MSLLNFFHKINQVVFILIFIFIFTPLILNAQAGQNETFSLGMKTFERESNYYNKFQKQKNYDNRIGNIGLLINPIGILQFGPIVQLEIRVGSGSIIGPHVRFAGFGLLTHVANDYDETSLGSMAVGFGFKQLIGPSSTRHKFYIGAVTEYGWGSGTSEEWDYVYGRDVDAEYQHKYISVVANTGYRWRFRSGMFLNLGAFAGAAFETEDIKTYPRNVEYPTEVLFLGMIEFSFGWEF
jgi:hypothetical protein